MILTAYFINDSLVLHTFKSYQNWFNFKTAYKLKAHLGTLFKNTNRSRVQVFSYFLRAGARSEEIPIGGLPGRS